MLMKTMITMTTDLAFGDLTIGDYTLSVSVFESGDGYTSDWWVSTKVSDFLRVVGHLSIPVYGANRERAFNAARNLAPQVAGFIESSWDGSGHVLDRPIHPEHVKAHMESHDSHISSYSEFEKTIMLYGLLSEFRVHNPAVVLKEHLGVNSVRTVHDRIARARREGLIDKLGQGRSHA